MCCAKDERGEKRTSAVKHIQNSNDISPSFSEIIEME